MIALGYAPCGTSVKTLFFSSSDTGRLTTGDGEVSFPISGPEYAEMGRKLVGVAGFEPATPSSRTRCATRLRYTPIFGRGAYIAFRPPRPQAQGALIARALVGIVRTRSRIADGVVHAIGLCLGLIGAVTIAVIAIRIERVEVAPILIYVIGLVTMLALSAAYNMWPVSPAKWVLRRFDHSAIYLLIAGTYMPFLAQMKSALVSAGLGVGVWASAVIGMALKLALPGRFDRLAVVLCLLLGWSGVIAYDSLASALPSASLWLLAIGGILYSVGALFHVWRGLRFHNAIWHGFVLIAASCHYSAVLLALDISGS